MSYLFFILWVLGRYLSYVGLCIWTFLYLLAYVLNSLRLDQYINFNPYTPRFFILVLIIGLYVWFILLLNHFYYKDSDSEVIKVKRGLKKFLYLSNRVLKKFKKIFMCLVHFFSKGSI